MGKLDEKIKKYQENARELGLPISAELINEVSRGLIPAIYQKDAETVSCSDSSELDTVRKNYLQKKLGLKNSDAELNSAIKKVCAKMGSSNRNKYRALFYALLVQDFGKESIYLKAQASRVFVKSVVRH
jgi:hypothetical protein